MSDRDYEQGRRDERRAAAARVEAAVEAMWPPESERGSALARAIAGRAAAAARGEAG